uniref:E3 ubiquitin-protein ligase listerin n=1 Tax=Timema californicum TaxID=61474 RepID=A0A7R9P7Q4_TIMCA|nr:unnamed protein product [Timema californicum]
MELCHENLDNSADDDEIKEDCNHLVSSQSWPLLQSHLLNILYANVIAHTFTEHFKSTLHYNSLAHKFELLNLRFCLFQEKSGFERDQLIIATQEKAKQEGDLWVKAALSLTDANFTWLSVEVGETDDSNNTSSPHADQLCKTNEVMSDTDPELPTLTLERLAVINNCQCQAGAKEESLIVNQLDNVGEAGSVVRVKRCCMCMIKANRTNLLFESHIGKLDWSDVQRLSEAARVMADVVNSNPEVLEQEVFDVVHITLTSWLASLEKSKESLLVPAGPFSLPLVTSTMNNRGASVENSVDAYKVAVLGANILQLFATLERFYATAEERKQSFYEEWKDVFAEEVYKSLLSIFIYVADHCDIQQLTCHDLLLLEPLCEAVSLMNPEYFLVHNNQAQERLKLVMKYCCHLVCSPIAPLQLVAYHVIKRLSRGLTSLDTVMVAAEADLANLHLWMLNGALELTQGFVDTLYSDQRLEEILRLLDVKVSKISEVLMSGLNLKYGVSSRSETLQDLACWMYFCSLRRLPAMVRQWWSGEEPRVASLVEKVTTRYMSPLLCSLEMQSVQKENTRTGNMAVKVHPTAREVVAVYHVDEVSLELSIQLPLNHPLGPVIVESSKQMVDTSQWRNWLMQLNVFLTYQNGSLWDGLALWKSNLDKRFEGIEECYICFSVIHGSNFQIPKLCCSTCKKKFHSPCLDTQVLQARRPGQASGGSDGLDSMVFTLLGYVTVQKFLLRCLVVVEWL